MSTETNHFADFGSVTAFSEERDLDPRAPETVALYGSELAERKIAVASIIGITPEELRIKQQSSEAL